MILIENETRLHRFMDAVFLRMDDLINYKPLTEQQIDALTANGCVCDKWEDVKVAEGFQAARVRNAKFNGGVNIGSNAGVDCGIYNAAISNCTIGSNVRICNVSRGISNYCIGDDVVIENVGIIAASVDAHCGNGVIVNAVNEAGGREVVLFNELSAQFAYLQCMHRHREGFVEKLNQIAKQYVSSSEMPYGIIGCGTKICSVKEIVDVNIDNAAVINGASSLCNGTILSGIRASASVGADVIARDFIIAEGAVVKDGANIEKVFVGQGSVVGKQFTAENCVIFANCEFLNGEAVSIFAGPYSVSHHKSTLLIAGLFSFYNAGSGTNQSNHMYRLGPVHEGKLQRGSKTGSFSYMLWPSSVGAFSVVLGKHGDVFDLGRLPFTRIMPGNDGKSYAQPGIQFIKSGTIRDSVKWAKRDKRSGKKTDVINYGMLTPYTVGAMIEGRRIIEKLLNENEGDLEYSGVVIRRKDAENALSLYGVAIDIYLLETIVNTAKKRFDKGVIRMNLLDVDAGAVYDPDWIDIAGQLVPKSCVEKLYEDVETGEVANIEQFHQYMTALNRKYGCNEWAYVCNTYNSIKGKPVCVKSIADYCEEVIRLKSNLVEAVISDARKEFSEQSQIGYGVDKTNCQADFEQVRGTLSGNDFIKTIEEQLHDLKNTSVSLMQLVQGNIHQ